MREWVKNPAENTKSLENSSTFLVKTLGTRALGKTLSVTLQKKGKAPTTATQIPTQIYDSQKKSPQEIEA